MKASGDWLWHQTRNHERSMKRARIVNRIRRWVYPTLAAIIAMLAVAFSAPDIDAELVQLHAEVSK